MTCLILNIDLSFLKNDAIIALVAFVFLYLTYYFSSDFTFVRKFNSRFKETPDDCEKSIYIRRLIGFVLLGVIPFLLTLFLFDQPITAYGIKFPSGKYVWLWFLIPTIVFSLASILRSKKSIDTSYYPEVRKKIWTHTRILTNSVFWIIYLLGYEFAIRGMVFFTCLYAFGFWPAAIINSVIYGLIHIFKGRGEAYGAVFLGIIFCLITYYTNSIWIAFIIHVMLALINDFRAINASKDMTYTK